MTLQAAHQTQVEPSQSAKSRALRAAHCDRSRGTMWINPRFRAHLAGRGLTNVDSVMQYAEGHLLRRLADRENWRLDLSDGERHTRAYLKKHCRRSSSMWLRAKLGLGLGCTPARVEAEHCTRLAEQNVPNMCVVAFGEKLDGAGRLQSFLITEELSGYTQLDEFLEVRFPKGAAIDAAALRMLIQSTAELAGRFHRLGYNHRDFYTCHFFIREPSPGRFDARLIDLQRVQHRRRFRRRWVVKDLAQLAYSAPEHCIGCRERMLFFKHYLGVEKLHPAHKRLLRSVLARERRMRRKLGPYR